MTKASVSVDGKVVSAIGPGICVFVGISKQDTKQDMQWLAKKVLNIKIWDSEEKKSWKRNVMQIEGEILFGMFSMYFLSFSQSVYS